MTPVQVLGNMFSVRDCIHYRHLQTTSYAEHQALGAFYDGWLDLVDTFVETWQGRYGRISGNLEVSVVSNTSSIEYLEEVRNSIETAYMGIVSDTDEDLKNILAEMLGLINKTLFLLTLS